MAMDWSPSKIIRIESGAVGISTNDLKALLQLYGIGGPEQTDALIELARASRQSSWWSKYRGDVSSQFLQYLEYEEAASILRVYEPLLIPGLLQTEEYADAVFRKLADSPVDLIEARLTIRRARQRLLEQESPPTSIFVIDEAAIRRLDGEPVIAPGQISKLVSLASRPNITIELVPFRAGLNRGMLEAFIVLGFPEPEESDVLFIETSRDLILSHDESGEISGYLQVFQDLRSISLGRDTVAYLANLADGIRQ
jgi:hypothetical protein